MIDKTDPEIQKYLEEELQRQKEQIAERILWRKAHFPFYNLICEDVVYCTGLSKEKVEQIANKCKWKLHYQEGWIEGALLSSAKLFRNFIKYEEHTPNNIDKEKKINDVTKTFTDEPLASEWRNNPDKYAVMELVKHGIENRDIMDGLELTYDQLQELYPTNEELEAYHPILDEKRKSDEELEESYQKMIRKKNYQ